MVVALGTGYRRRFVPEKGDIGGFADSHGDGLGSKGTVVVAARRIYSDRLLELIRERQLFLLFFGIDFGLKVDIAEADFFCDVYRGFHLSVTGGGIAFHDEGGFVRFGDLFQEFGEIAEGGFFALEEDVVFGDGEGDGFRGLGRRRLVGRWVIKGGACCGLRWLTAWIRQRASRRGDYSLRDYGVASRGSEGEEDEGEGDEEQPAACTEAAGLDFVAHDVLQTFLQFGVAFEDSEKTERD